MSIGSREGVLFVENGTAQPRRLDRECASGVAAVSDTLNQANRSDIVELSDGGTVMLLEDGEPHLGTYEVRGRVLTINIDDHPITASRSGSHFVDERGVVWTKIKE